MTAPTQERPKYYFAALPARVLQDDRLTGTHFRVLGIIALHDRMSSGTNGQGCWASIKRLADLCGCNYTNFSTALNELGAFGYIESDRQPTDRRLRVLRVIYTGQDEAVPKSM